MPIPDRIRLLVGAFVAGAGLIAAAPCRALDGRELAVVINEDDPVSVSAGVYYAEQRDLPARNIIRVRMGVPGGVLAPDDFASILTLVQAKTPPEIQAYALAWTLPYRVGCMSVTSAFAFGYSKRYCAAGCAPTAPSPYYNSASRRPRDDFHMRPAMLLAAETFAAAKRLIDRGLQADGSRPRGRAYLVITADQARNSRAPLFPAVRQEFAERIPVDILLSEGIRDRWDIMFYFTGAARVPYLNTLGFLPGAIADHLTSNGGALNGTKQMSAMRWLEAGATGSYGTVVEPCNFPQKFPTPGLVMKYYLAGATLIEAYWKSVVWPGQGVFIGEPLARPYGPRD